MTISTRKVWENKERAFIAASRRHDRSLEARCKSAEEASTLHFQYTGKRLRITEQAVRDDLVYEEIDPRFEAHLSSLSHLKTDNPQFDTAFDAYYIDRTIGRDAVRELVLFQGLDTKPARAQVDAQFPPLARFHPYSDPQRRRTSHVRIPSDQSICRAGRRLPSRSDFDIGSFTTVYDTHIQQMAVAPSQQYQQYKMHKELAEILSGPGIPSNSAAMIVPTRKDVSFPAECISKQTSGSPPSTQTWETPASFNKPPTISSFANSELDVDSLIYMSQISLIVNANTIYQDIGNTQISNTNCDPFEYVNQPGSIQEEDFWSKYLNLGFVEF